MINRRQFVRGSLALCSAPFIPVSTCEPAGCTNENLQTQLRDGRRLGFALYGNPTGFPVLYFHGNPTSRIEARFYSQAAFNHDCCLIALDRPGYGLSDPQPGRRICDWFNDVREFIEPGVHPANLDLNEFSIASFSSGSAYALGCAASIAESRIRSVAVVSGVAPLEQIHGNGGYSALAFRLANRRPRLARSIFNLNTRQIRRRPNRVLQRTSRFFSRSDTRIFTEPRTARILIDSYLQAVRCGPQGVIHDMSLLSRPWGFDPGQIPNRVQLWYGACDLTVPPESMGDCLNRRLTNAQLTIVPGEGHLSMLDGMGDAIFRQLVTDAGLK